MEDKRTGKLRQVRALLDKAASSRELGHYQEAEAFEAGADRLMTAYTIESWELEFAKPVGEREKPEFREFEYGFLMPGYSREAAEINGALCDMFYSLARFCRVKIGWYGTRKSKVVGFKADLDYLDLLFTTARLHLAGNLEPKLIAAFDEYENFVIMKEAGMKWERIWQLLHPDTPFNRSHCQKLLRRYGEECKAAGKPQMKGDPRIYQRSFVDGFVDRLKVRLYGMEESRDTMGHELVLANRDDDLLNMLWELFPNLRPHPDGCDCEVHHSVRCSDQKCKRAGCVAKRKPVRYSKGPAPLKTDYAARLNGASAADKVQLSGRGRTVEGGVKGEVS